jgi:flagellar basal body-associated protein FliL
MKEKKLIVIILLSLIASFNAAYLTYSAYLSEDAQKVF